MFQKIIFLERFSFKKYVSCYCLLLKATETTMIRRAGGKMFKPQGQETEGKVYGRWNVEGGPGQI